MTNAEQILRALDARLSAPIDLTLYGRSALALGFDEPPMDALRTVDVDVVLWIGQAEALAETTDFWDAVSVVNKEFESSGLYMTHFFTEDQVIVRPAWKSERVPVKLALNRLQLHRLADPDLWLSKLMRFDPIDQADAAFIARRNRWTRAEAQQFIMSARVPPVPELEEAFRVSTETALQLLPGV